MANPEEGSRKPSGHSGPDQGGCISARPTFPHGCSPDPGGLSIVDSWSDGGVAVCGGNETDTFSFELGLDIRQCLIDYRDIDNR